jgi:AcrR family transcriptional regulator
MTARTATTARPALSREVILEAAMRLAAQDGTLSLSLTRLGRELAADPTAMYRHFRNKDELVLAMGDELIAEAAARVPEVDDPIELLRLMAWSLRDSYLARPALAVMVAPRFTGGEAERSTVARLVDRLIAAGLERSTAAEHMRGYFEMVLGHIVMTGTLLTLTDDQQRGDVAIGLRVYEQAFRPPVPALVEEGVRSAREDGDQVFHMLLETFLRGVEAVVARTANTTG